MPLDVLAIAIVGTVLILLREINYGVDVGYDGSAYLIRARRILEGPSWLVHTSGIQPPLFPLLIAFVGIFGIGLVHVAGFVNAVAFGLTILFSGLWLRTRLHSPLIATWATVAICLSIPLTSLASQAVSEPVFMLFTVLALIQAEVFLDRNTPASLIRAALFSALACLTRYPGVAIIPAVALPLLLQRSATFQEKFRQTVTYSFIALVPCCLFLSRNWLLSGAFFWHSRLLQGYVSASDPPFAQHLYHALKEIAGWAFPISSNPQAGMQGVANWLPLICLLVWVPAAGYLFLRSMRPVRLNLPVPFWLFAFIYFVLIFAITMLDSEGGVLLRRRHLAPLYIPLIFIVSVAVDGLLKERLGPLPGDDSVAETKQADWHDRPVRIVLIAAMLLWLPFPAMRYAHDMAVHLDRGYMYTSVDWRNSAIVRYLREHSIDDPVYTNRDDPLEFLTGFRTTRLRTPEQLREMMITPSVHIVWFPLGHGRQSKKLRSAIEGLSDIETVFTEAQGVIYRLSLRGSRGLDEIMGSTSPIIRSSAYDVYLDGDRLVYVRRKVTAVQKGANRRFFLHLVPADRKNLHQARAWLGRRQYDWTEDCSWRSAGKCAAVVRLPKYAIASIRTGQYLAGPNRTYGDLSYRRAAEVMWDFIATGRFVLEDHVWEGHYRFRPSITPAL